jgi:hypothetical protein
MRTAINAVAAAVRQETGPLIAQVDGLHWAQVGAGLLPSTHAAFIRADGFATPPYLDPAVPDKAKMIRRGKTIGDFMAVPFTKQ